MKLEKKSTSLGGEGRRRGEKYKTDEGRKKAGRGRDRWWWWWWWCAGVGEMKRKTYKTQACT